MVTALHKKDGYLAACWTENKLLKKQRQTKNPSFTYLVVTSGSIVPCQGSSWAIISRKAIVSVDRKVLQHMNFSESVTRQRHINFDRLVYQHKPL